MKPSAIVPDHAPPPPFRPYIHGLDKLSDDELQVNILNMISRLLQASSTGETLPYGGLKIRATIRLYEEEVERRKGDPHPQESQVVERPSAMVSDHVSPPPYVHGLDKLSDSELLENIQKCNTRLTNLECNTNGNRAYKAAKLDATVKLYRDELIHRGKAKILHSMNQSSKCKP